MCSERALHEVILKFHAKLASGERVTSLMPKEMFQIILKMFCFESDGDTVSIYFQTPHVSHTHDPLVCEIITCPTPWKFCKIKH